MEQGWLLRTDKKKESVKNLFSYLGVFAAAATVIIFSALFFTDVSLTAESGVSFSLSFLLLFISAYIMYASLFETGGSLSMREEGYRTLLSRRDALFSRLRTEGTQEALSFFCRRISREETERERESILHLHFTTEKEIAAWKAMPRRELGRRERRALRALARQRAVTVTPRALLAERPAAARHAPLSASPDRCRLHRTLSFLLPLALVTVLSVSVACEVILNPSPGAVVAYLLKLFTLIQSGIKGFKAGAQHVAEDKCEYMREQCELLEEYFKSLSEQPTEENAP
ncbi:MAG: hypothetical protein E7609_03765 [Ruminococcaceae bacterium]|nr:hypothetical protein [Oscillospiraceae bacterium]